MKMPAKFGEPAESLAGTRTPVQDPNALGKETETPRKVKSSLDLN